MEKFEQATVCWICEKPFEVGDKRVRDHCHFTGKFRGAAHEKCNLLCKAPKFTPVFFHNLKGYDAHFIVKALGSIPGEIKCLANNEEKYISFSKMIKLGVFRNKKGHLQTIWHEIRFLDSMGFMNSALARLAANLTDDNLIETKKVMKEHWPLARQKGVFPYEWLTSVEKFKLPLPEKEKFYSQVNEEGISEKDYQHAQKVWKELNMNNLGDYHDFYLLSDVTLLADVYEEFRKVCFMNYALDPAWFYTSPALAWDAALKESQVKLELLTDPDMLIFFEQGIQGGVSTIFHRRAKANNKYMKNFDANKASTFLAYWDANGLYAWAMTHPLPTGNFKWMTSNEIDEWENHPCVLECDIDIPEELHDKFNDFPPLPERKLINKVEKLIPNLWNKRGIILHWRILKQALALGCKLVKIHRGISFDEKPWLKTFIDMNVILRQKSKNAFEKDFFKLMNNAVFGKTMENIRKRKDIRPINSEEQFLKLTSKPNFDHFTIFDETLVAAHMRKTSLLFNKPVYVEQAILDISKTCMYKFHYEYVKQKWNKAQLCFTDTDSLLYKIETEDLFEDISPDIKKDLTHMSLQQNIQKWWMEQ